MIFDKKERKKTLSDLGTEKSRIHTIVDSIANGRPVLSRKKECLGAVINIVDITTIKVLDRLKSEFVAKVSHELRSPPCYHP